MLSGGRPAGHLPRHPRPRRLRRRARPALDRLPARLRAEQALLRLLHGQGREHPRRRIQAPQRDPGRAGSRRAGDRDPAPGQRQPQRRPAAVPRRPPLLRHRRRRLRRRSAQQRPEQRRAAGQAAADRPAARRRASPTRCRRATRSSASRAATRSTATACATPSASPSTRSATGQPRIAIGDVGQNQFEELDYTTVAAAGGANFGWDAFEGFAPYEDENSGTADPGGTVKPIFAYPHSRGGSCSIIGGYVVRDRSLPRSHKRYVYADLCEGQLRSLVPHLKRASGDRKLGLAVASPSSFGEDDAAPRLRRLARRPGLPPRPKVTLLAFLRHLSQLLSTVDFMADGAERELDRRAPGRPRQAGRHTEFDARNDTWRRARSEVTRPRFDSAVAIGNRRGHRCRHASSSSSPSSDWPLGWLTSQTGEGSSGGERNGGRSTETNGEPAAAETIDVLNPATGR